MPKPDILQKVDLTDRRFERIAWAVDIQLEKYAPNIVNTNEKYGFPCRRDISYAFYPARGSKDGNVVINASASEKQGRIKTPQKRELFFHLLTGYYHTVFYKHGEHPIRQNKHKAIGTSEKGKYLRGFIDLFGSIESAANYLESPFWRELLEYELREMFKRW